MTKEELEKEAEEWLGNNLHSASEEDFIKAMVDIAEPREKRIAELEATCNKWFEHLKNREEELLNELNNQNVKYNKQIEELEDKLANADYQLEGRDVKIAELEHQLTHRNCVDCSNHSSKLRMRNLDLEKENAELKEKYAKNITDCDICDTYCNSQLTKAKEIIREFVEWANWQGNSKCPSFKSIQDKAEQFLSEVEK